MLPVVRFSLLALLLSVASPDANADDPLTIAVASNFAPTLKLIVDAWERQSDGQARISSASSGKIVNQVMFGAPYDLFLSADRSRPARLLLDGHAVEGSDFVYAVGRLVLWSRDPKYDGSGCREDLETLEPRRIALANPLFSPYGLAAKEFLQNSGNEHIVNQKFIIGENIAQTFQFAAMGRVQMGLVARAQLNIPNLPEATCTWNVPTKLHSPIEQVAVLLEHGKDRPDATSFLEFLKGPAAREIIESQGYLLPGGDP